MNSPFLRTAAFLSLFQMIAVPASAQDATGTSAPASSGVTWRFEAGRNSLWIRDVARSRLGQGVDASPVSWEAHGAAVTVERDHSSARRLHRIQASFEQAADAVFRSPLAASARPAGDGAIRVAGSIERGSYPFVDLGVAGFDVGFSLQGGAEWTSVIQHFDPAIEVRVTEANLTTGVAAVARLRRWRRVHLDAAWVNGSVLVRTTTQHSAAVEANVHDWGIGWLTDVTVRAHARVSSTVAISASYFGTDRGRFVSHGASASGRRRWTVGVSYAR
ncbi:MAG TPA: hypothetical protein VLH75_08530 [Longimicrobiales bacterium]|nr:hypothetical protein [Longimicrobiales bacterium]